ncbi:MAG TPA: SMP-30/gluconolactonase/LRE family protein [Lacipirellulaceae bacterium]|jgi:gluconolactonase|nr:SMP-30/gluconolactonase/LRE family protein [Lacipirellulaceae bacterium]
MDAKIPIEQFEVFAGGLDHPECCAFDRVGNLWAGGEAGQIYRIDPAGQVKTMANVGGFCCGVALSPDDQELFVCVSGVGVVRVSKQGAHQSFASHAGDYKIVAPNYLLFDQRGRLYVTDSGNWMKRNGFLLRFDADGIGTVLAGPFGYANGLALSADEQSLFMVESDTDSVLRFDIRADATLTQPEIYANHVGRLPDGIALDAAGNLYICCYASDEIWRIGVDGQKTLVGHDRWGILLGRPTNLAFGGLNFDEIYVANLGRYTITRAKLGIRGRLPANLADAT